MKNYTDTWLTWTAVAFLIAFLCLTLGCQPKPPRPPLPPDLSVPYCRTMVVVTPEDLCGMTTSFAPFYQCVKCQGGEGCVARDLAIYCIGGRAGCGGDPVCGFDGRAK
jgi:hypothetical protein